LPTDVIPPVTSETQPVEDVIMQRDSVICSADNEMWRAIGEMGGDGNLARLRETLDEVLVVRGYGPPTYAANWYPSVEEFTSVYEYAGFKDVDARLIERPTPLEHGVAAWVTTFRKGWLDRAGVPEEERAEIAAAVADRIGSNIADYVRLRFIMRKPA
jgi:hypothetical protein